MKKAMAKKVIVILGPTATGKTKLAVKLAHRHNGEIISADSRQVYRGMDIGTGKDLRDYFFIIKNKKSRIKIKHHLIDILSPKTDFNVAKYQRLAYKAINEVIKKGKVPFLVGGTGLYIDAVVKGFVFAGQGDKENSKAIRGSLDKLNLNELLSKLNQADPATYRLIDKKNRRRVQRALEIFYESGRLKSQQSPCEKPPYDFLLLGIGLPLPEIYRRIDSRLEARIKEGMIGEIKRLRRRGVSWKRLDDFGLEYRHVSRYLRGLLTYDQLLEQLKNAIHHFAKRQLTWFKRNGDIVWISSVAAAEKSIKKFL